GGIAFNFSDESPRTVMDMYDAVCRAVGQEVEPKILGEASDEIQEQHLDATRAREELGWRAAVDLDAGMEHAAEWYSRLLGPA
ncbi:MAG: sugar dehydratase, partial [Acidimicrobiales bacterium]